MAQSAAKKTRQFFYLNDYIDSVDDNKPQAMYIILQTDIDYDQSYSDAVMAMLHERRDNHLNGSSVSYTVNETLAFASGRGK